MTHGEAEREAGVRANRPLFRGVPSGVLVLGGTAVPRSLVGGARSRTEARCEAPLALVTRLG